MASFRCYDNCDVIATLIITNFHLHLMQLWWKRFPNRCFGGLCSKLGGIDPKNPMEPPLRGRLARIEHVKLKYLKSWILRTFSTNILTPLKRTLARKNSALEPFLLVQPTGRALPSVPPLCYFKSRRINVMFNEQAAVFLSGLKSRDEIDRYE